MAGEAPRIPTRAQRGVRIRRAGRWFSPEEVPPRPDQDPEGVPPRPDQDPEAALPRQAPAPAQPDQAQAHRKAVQVRPSGNRTRDEGLQAQAERARTQRTEARCQTGPGRKPPPVARHRQDRRKPPYRRLKLHLHEPRLPLRPSPAGAPANSDGRTHPNLPPRQPTSAQQRHELTSGLPEPAQHASAAAANPPIGENRPTGSPPSGPACRRRSGSGRRGRSRRRRQRHLPPTRLGRGTKGLPGQPPTSLGVPDNTTESRSDQTRRLPGSGDQLPKPQQHTATRSSTNLNRPGLSRRSGPPGRVVLIG